MSLHQLVALAIALPLTSECIQKTSEETSELVSESYSFTDPDQQKRLEQGLTAARVPFSVEMIDGTETITWRGEHAIEANAVRIPILGPDLPNGRHVGYDDETLAKFESWLKERGIPYSRVDKDGRDYVIWEEAANKRVREWPSPLPPE